MDVYIWGKILQNALTLGIDWLDIEEDESPVWRGLAHHIIDGHGCQTHTNCRNSRCTLASLPVHRHALVKKGLGPLSYEGFALRVLDLPGTNRPVTFGLALRDFLHPSFCELLLQEVYRNRCSDENYKDLPPDMRLNLALIQSPSILSTSLSRDDDWQAVIHQTIYAIRQYVAVDADYEKSLRHHWMVVKATFASLSAVVLSVLGGCLDI